jgi:hypothetical protein
MKKRILVSCILFLIFGIYAKIAAQCNNVNNYGAFGSATGPAQGASVQITACNYAGEYATLNTIVAGRTYSCTSSIVTDYITIRSGTPGGQVIAFGITPLIWTAPTSGTYYMHINTNSACGIVAGCRDTRIGCFGANGAGTCTNTSAFGSMVAPGPGLGATVSCNYAMEYATVSNVVAGATYSSSSSIATDFITIRSGSNTGPVVAAGTSPLQWTAIVAGNHFIAINTNSACGTSATCRDNRLFRLGNPACSGSPNAGIATITSATGCPSAAFILDATGLSNSSGLTFQWQSSSSLAGPYANLGGASATSSLSTSTISTTYYRLVTTCTVSALSNTTSVISYSVVNPGPCQCAAYGASSATDAFDEEILSVRIGNWVNNSTCASVGPGPGSIQNRYSNYAGFVVPPDLCPLSTQNYTVQLGTCNGWYSVQYSIYADWNQDGLFTGPGELLANVTTGVIQGNNTGTFTIPSNASLGTTRLRVIAVEGAVPGPTGNYSWGETEDYCVNIIASPTISAAGGSVCPGAPFVLNPSGATSYTYAIPGGSTLTGVSATVNPITASVYTISGTGANGCRSTANTNASVTVNLFSAPNLNVIASASAFCQGNSATLTVSGANTYTWANTNTSTTQLVVTPSITTIYTVSGTGITPCNGVTTQTLVVYPLPTITVNSGTICTGYGYTLNPTGANAYTYSSGSNTVAPLTNTFYTITGTSSNNCISANAATANITVIPSPTIVASNGTICIGNTFSINPSGASTYSVNGISNLNGTVAPIQSSSFAVTGTGTNGCVSPLSAVVNVTVFNNPTVSIVPSTSAICQLQSAVLTGSGAVTYSWSNATSGNTTAVSPTVSSSYQVVGFDALGCSSTSSVTILVNVLPNTSALANKLLYCVGDTAQLSANITFPSGVNTYSWSTGSSGSTTTVNPIVSTVYSVVGTSSAGCNNTATVLVNMNSNSLTVTPASTVCVGKSINLTASGATSYTWNGSNPFSSIVVSPVQNTVYAVAAIDSNFCLLTASVAITMAQNPTVIAIANRTVMCVNETNSIMASGANTYSWNTGITSSSFALTPSTNVIYSYTVTGTGLNNCTSIATLKVFVNSCTGISESIFPQWTVFPNPSHGLYVVDLGTEQFCKITVTDISGRLIVQEQIHDSRYEVDLSNFSNGLYYLNIISDNHSQTLRLIKE